MSKVLNLATNWSDITPYFTNGVQDVPWALTGNAVFTANGIQVGGYNTSLGDGYAYTVNKVDLSGISSLNFSGMALRGSGTAWIGIASVQTPASPIKKYDFPNVTSTYQSISGSIGTSDLDGEYYIVLFAIASRASISISKIWGE